jgi:hypothetical protein
MMVRGKNRIDEEEVSEYIPATEKPLTEGTIARRANSTKYQVDQVQS